MAKGDFDYIPSVGPDPGKESTLNSGFHDSSTLYYDPKAGWKPKETSSSSGGSSGGDGGGGGHGGGGGGGGGGPTAPKLTKKPSQKLEPYLREVSGKELVKNQLYGLLSSQSPYMQAARQRGIRYAAARGLQNTSMAAQAGEAAAIQGALPIAQTDARTEFEQGLVNQQAINTARAISFQEAQANWRAENQFNLGVFNIESANWRSAQQISASFALAKMGYEHQLQMQYNDFMGQLALSGATGPQTAEAQDNINKLFGKQSSNADMYAQLT